MRREVACVLRNTGSGWFIDNTAGHVPLGTASLVQNSTCLQLNFNFVSNAVHTFQVTCDDYYGTRGISVGASVAMDKANLYFSEIVSGTAVACAPSTLANPSGAVFVYGLFSE